MTLGTLSFCIPDQRNERNDIVAFGVVIAILILEDRFVPELYNLQS